MSINQSSSLQTLPVEIVHRIFDLLDIQTIVLSVRNTCRQLRAYVRSYNRYKINLNSIHFSKLQLIRRAITPDQIQSLTISQSLGGYETLFRTKELTQVRTLTLIEMRESALRDIMKLINISALISLSIDVKEANRHSNSTATYLTSILLRSKLRKLVLNMESDRLEDIKLFGQYNIEYLELSRCIPLKQINRMLRSMPRLKTLMIGSCSMNDIPQNKLVPFESVTALTLKQMNMEVKHFEVLLQLMPSLTHLNLIGSGDLFDGHRWERLIQTHLLLLNNFEFVFNSNRNDQFDCADIERIVRSFQTPFWLQLKKWFVTGEYAMNSPQSFQLYSIPKSTLLKQQTFESTTISISTTHKKYNEDTFLHVMVDEITFRFPKLSTSDIEQYLLTNEKRDFFCNMKKLVLILDSTRSLDWMFIVSTFTDLTTITSIAILSSTFHHGHLNIVPDMSNLLRQAFNTSTLSICNWSSNSELSLTADEICQMVPTHVRYLTVSNIKLDEVIIVLEKVKHLSAARFIFKKTQDWSHFHRWSQTKKRKIISRIENSSLRVWFKANENIESNEMNSSCKRIKLTDDHHD